MDNSQSEQDQKEELASLYSDISKSIYGVRLSIDPNDYTLEELQAELDALDGMEYIYKDEEEHYSLLDSYEEEQKAREPGEHTHDFFDTMDFKKDKAKLRNTSSFRESRKPKMTTKTITKSQLRQMIKEAIREQLESKPQRHNSRPVVEAIEANIDNLEELGEEDAHANGQEYDDEWENAEAQNLAKRYYIGLLPKDIVLPRVRGNINIQKGWYVGSVSIVTRMMFTGPFPSRSAAMSIVPKNLL